MRIELYLNPKSEGYDTLQRDLRTELQALPNISYTEAKTPPPPNTLNIEGDVLKFLIDHYQALGATAATVTIVRGMLELVRAIVTRRSINTTPTPLVTIVVNGASLDIPSTPQKEVRFLKRLEQTKAPPLRNRKSAKRRKTESSPKESKAGSGTKGPQRKR